MMKQLDKLQRDSVQAELRLARAKRARIGALNRLVDARKNLRATQRLYLRGDVTGQSHKQARVLVNRARGVWARSVVCSEAASNRAFDAGFDLREAYRAREPLRAR